MDSIQSAIPYYTAPISVIANTFLIFLIIFKSPPQMGNYKYLLIGVSIFEILYGLLDIVTEATVLSIGPSFVVVVPYKDRFFGKEVARIFNCLYCGFFGFSMGMFVIIFAYRLLVATENSLLKKFQGAKILLWFGYPMFYLLVFGAVAWFPYSPSPEMDEFISFSLIERLNMTLDEVVYTGPLYYSPANDSIRYDTLIVSLLQLFLVVSSLILVLFFGIKCYFYIMKFAYIQDSISIKMKNLQKQLFFALVFQALVPLVLMHIPVTILYSFSLLNIVFSSFSVATTIALFPALDPFPTIFIVKTYRLAIFDFFQHFFKCLRKKLCEFSAGND